MHDEGFRHLLAVEYDRRACGTLLANRATPFDPAEVESAEFDSAPFDAAGFDPNASDSNARLDATGRPSGTDRWPLVEGDVRAVDFHRWEGRVDVVAGGVPC